MRKIIVCLLTGTILAAAGPAGAQDAEPAKKPSPRTTTRPREIRPLLGAVMFPKLSLGDKIPAAIVLEPRGDKGEEFVLKWRRALTDCGFCVFQTQAPSDGWKGADGPGLVKEFDKRVPKDKVDPKRILIVTGRDGGSAAMSLIEKHPKRVAGALMISVSPWIRSADIIKLWRPSKDAWSIPIWSTIPANIEDGAPMLLLWRQIAAGRPKDASLTIDPRLQKGDTNPDKSVSQWLSVIAGGKKPKPGPDAQAALETKRYAGPARQLLAAMQVTTPADAGAKISKAEGPMTIDVTAPDKWIRAEQGERKYDAEEMPYVQIYITPRMGGMLFARASAAEWSADANGLLDQYEKRLADGGYLTVRHSRWRTKGYSLQISSILWPTRGKWHRWFVLAAAGAGRKNAPAAPMVVVMDASDIPDTNKMAAAMKRILPGVSVAWKGLPKKKPAPAE